MKKIGIFYGSSTGATKKVANKIAAKLNVSPNDVHDVSATGPAAVGEYEMLLLGSSTWGAGELQTDWLDFADGLKALTLKGKTVAVFGCGTDNMKKTFCNAVGRIYDMASEAGAEMIGQFNADGYNFKTSLAVFDDSGLMKGLVLDETNHSDLTDARIQAWTDVLAGEIA